MSGPAAATIGVFDGVHRGHALLASETMKQARIIGGDAVAFTFDPHPARVLAPDHAAPPYITTAAERRALLEARGLVRVHTLAFDSTMAALSPEAFVEAHLQEREDLRRLVIGYDFALGRGRTGNAERLAAIGRERGFEVVQVPPLVEGGEAISSSRIRRAVRAADFDAARLLLGRPFTISGRVVAGDGRGRTLGFPTANVALDPDRLVPPFGVYAGRVAIDGAGETRPAVMNFGVRPTFGSGSAGLEIHLLDFSGDLAGAELSVEFTARVREERRFGGPGELVEQIRKDVASARRMLQDEGRTPT